MAVPIYTSDLTTLIPDDVASTSNRAALWGWASGLNIETDYFIQGANCMSKNAFASATKGMVEDTTATLLTTGDLKAVYLTGDIAQGMDSNLIDLILVGSIDQTYLLTLIEKAEKLIKRKIRYLIYSEEEFLSLANEKSDFLLMWNSTN